MIKNCVNCAKEMKAKKASKKYCSDKCKMRSYRKRDRLGEKIGIMPKTYLYAPFTHCNNFDCKIYLAHDRDFFNAFTKSYVKPINEKEYRAMQRISYKNVEGMSVVHCPLCLEQHWFIRPLL